MTTPSIKKSSSFHGLENVAFVTGESRNTVDRSTSLQSLDPPMTSENIRWETKRVVMNYLGLPDVDADYQYMPLSVEGLSSSDEDFRLLSPRRSPRRLLERKLQVHHQRKVKSFDLGETEHNRGHNSLNLRVPSHRKAKSFDDRHAEDFEGQSNSNIDHKEHQLKKTSPRLSRMHAVSNESAGNETRNWLNRMRSMHISDTNTVNDAIYMHNSLDGDFASVTSSIQSSSSDDVQIESLSTGSFEIRQGQLDSYVEEDRVVSIDDKNISVPQIGGDRSRLKIDINSARYHNQHSRNHVEQDERYDSFTTTSLQHDSRRGYTYAQTVTPLTPQSEVARRIGIIGDQVAREFGDRIGAAAKDLLSRPRKDVSYEVFSKVATDAAQVTDAKEKKLSVFLELSRVIADGFRSKGEQLGDLVDYTTNLLVDQAADYIIKQGGWSSIASSVYTGSERDTASSPESTPITPAPHDGCLPLTPLNDGTISTSTTLETIRPSSPNACNDHTLDNPQHHSAKNGQCSPVELISSINLPSSNENSVSSPANDLNMEDSLQRELGFESESESESDIYFESTFSSAEWEPPKANNVFGYWLKFGTLFLAIVIGIVYRVYRR